MTSNPLRLKVLVFRFWFFIKRQCSEFMVAPVNNNTRKQICPNKIFFFDTKDSYKLGMNSNKDG